MTEVLMIAAAIVFAGFLIDVSIMRGRDMLARRKRNREQQSGGRGG